VAELIETAATAGLLPLAAGTCRLAEAAPARITLVAPFRGRHEAASQALATALGPALPEPGQSSGEGPERVLWHGLGQFVVLGERALPETLAQSAAIVDVSDGWCVLRLTGADAEAVMARVCPLDLDPGVFRQGRTARSEITHMMAQITRRDEGLEIMVMRSMAASAVQVLAAAMRSVAAQRAAAGDRAPA
jgi:sarcosine oxidase subunit gamma